MIAPDPPPIEAIIERDIDLLLLEEMHASRNFVDWLISRTFDSNERCSEFISARHSVSNEDGESDLILVFRDMLGGTCGLLLEDKLNAPPQPDQAARYRQRAEAGKNAGQWDRWKTAIIAPREYLQTKADGYDARVSYEDIATWYEASAPNDPRAAYRARVIKDAIVRARRVGISRIDEVITAFWRSYWADVSLLYPELEMKEPAPKGPNSTWIQFRPTRLEAGRTLDHKLWRGCLDLSFPNISPTRLSEIRDRWSTILATQDLTAEQTGGSCAVRAVVPLINPREEYSTQQTPARAGMKAAYRLLYLSHLLHVPSAGSEK